MSTETESAESSNDLQPEDSTSKDENVFSIPQVPFLAPKPVSSANKPQSAPHSNKPAPPVATLDYTEPPWSAQPAETDEYFLEVIKNGTIVEKIVLTKKCFFSFGRLATCDVQLEHPSLSRFHAILQYSNGDSDAQFKKGFHLYDLNSTHGTVVNKTRLEPRKYVHLGGGSCLKFGASTRIYVYHEPEQPNTDDLNINVTHEQMRKIKEKYSKMAMKMKIRKEVEDEEMKDEDEEPQSVDWGMSRNEADEELNADAKELEGAIGGGITENDESFYSSDPKKALKTYFDREGDELFYEVEELGTGKFKCRVRLPIYNNLGEAMYAEAQGHGKKKEIVAQCALEACRVLDAQGVLRESKDGKSTAKRKQKDWENNDFYDSDEDNYLDRTGDIEKKRIKRMEKSGKAGGEGDAAAAKKVHTLESLKSDFEALVREQREINGKLESCRSVIKAVQDDDLDAYISSLKSGNTLDTMTRTRLKRRLLDLNQEIVKCEKLLAVALPHGFDLNKWKYEVRSEKVEVRVPERRDEVPIRQPVERIQIERKIVKKEEGVETKKEVEKVAVEAKVEKKAVVKPKVQPVVVEPVKSETKEKEYYYPPNDKDYSMWMPPESKFGAILYYGFLLNLIF